MECSSRWRLTDLFGYNFLSSCYTFHYSSRLPGAFTKMSEFNNPTARTRVVREPHRGVYDRAEAYKILFSVFHRSCRSQHDDRAVIHGVIKNRACEHKPVENGHCDANRDAFVHVPQHAARG